MYQINTFNLHKVRCELCLSKTGGKVTYLAFENVVVFESMLHVHF